MIQTLPILAALVALSGNHQVAVNACTIEQTYIPVSSGDVQQSELAASSLRIRFTNNTDKDASNVVFAITDESGASAQIVDSGRFSPGIAISHSFPSPWLTAANATCTVQSVNFVGDRTADGPRA
jgi:hypothetical protein